MTDNLLRRLVCANVCTIRVMFAAALSALALTIWLPHLAEAAATDYRFDLIADVSPANSGTILGTTSMNNSGTVAFRAPDTSGGFGLFTGSGGALTPIADTSGEFSHIGGFSINDTSTVAFGAQLAAGGHGIFTGSGGAATTIADSSGPLAIVTGFGNPAINNGGTVAFLTTPNIAGSGLYAGSGGAVTTIADTNGPLSRIISFPSINDNGTVTFAADFDGGGSAILTGTGGDLTTIADTSGEFNSVRLATINNSGTVAFVARSDADGSEIITSSGGTLTTFADNSGEFDVFSLPRINNNGEIAFVAFLDAGDFGLFAGDDPVADLVIQRFDALLGSSLMAIDFGPEFNDLGQISFAAVLSDGRSVIVRATPVPEPSTFVMSIVLGISWRGSRRWHTSAPQREKGSNA